MFLLDVLFALLIAIAVTAVFVVLLRKRGPWPSVWMFFAVIFLVSWAGSLWIVATGPVFYGIPWLTILIIGLITAVLLASVAPPQPPRTKAEVAEKAKQVEATEEVFNFFFWILVILLVFVIVLGYWSLPRAY
ncbi:MAG: hypothetical protein GF409_07660 [Candidatus Omnitrophica bacterium]|nr:hypothetical protein [Candidatus Omnitrophota bacterium]